MASPLEIVADNVGEKLLWEKACNPMDQNSCYFETGAIHPDKNCIVS